MTTTHNTQDSNTHFAQGKLKGSLLVAVFHWLMSTELGVGTRAISFEAPVQLAMHFWKGVPRKLLDHPLFSHSHLRDARPQPPELLTVSQLVHIILPLLAFA